VWRSARPRWRGLAIFWALLLAAGAAAAGVLAWLGPAPPAPETVPPKPAAASAPASALPPLLVPAAPARATASQSEGARRGGRIPAPDAALEQPGPDGGTLPRIGPDRRSPMLAYAAYADPADNRPRIAILLSGVGLSQSDSLAAIHDLPAQVSLAVSPAGAHLPALQAAARAAGHEMLVGLPMGGAGGPGDHALREGDSAAADAQRLDWALSRLRGYVGATGEMATRGERLPDAAQLRPVLAELAQRGLLYVDPRPRAAHPPLVVGRAVDEVLDDPPDAAAIDAKLARLERIAHDRGSAIGLAGPPRPVTVQRLAAWAATLATRGVALMPVSAVAPIVPAAP
jgi:polysaccharide deacetylase 2 family uncharacterized protein YibQ